jgi:hypothetical protein
VGDLVRQTLGGAGQIVIGGGLYFKLIQTGAPVDITFETGGATHRVTGVEAGYQYGPLPEGERFRKVVIASSGAQTIAAFAGENFEDYERIIGVFQVAQPVSVADAPDVNVGGSAVALQLVPANPSRRRVTLKLNAGADVNIRVGVQGSVAGNRGLQLEPGQSITLEPSGRIDAIREAAGTAVVSIIEETF